jgi:predicted CoA-substrate-specific enzyme activase
LSVLGIDVGSTTAKVVVLEGSTLAFHACERHRGRAREVALELLARARSTLVGGGHDAPIALGVTGSIGAALAAELGGSFVHEVDAVVTATRAREPDTRVIVELGGQDAKLVFLGRRPLPLARSEAAPTHARRGGCDDPQMNDRCAAGTGATLDRVARRLAFAEAEIATLRLSGDLRVAAKCGVFAERDVVNLIKLGASPADAMSALLRAIVVQNLAVLARGRVIAPPVLLLGGPLAHVPALVDAFREALADLFGREATARERAHESAGADVRVPAHAELFAAIGAAERARTAAHALAGSFSEAPVRGVLGALGGVRDRGPLGADAALAASLADRRAPVPWPRGAVAVDLGLDAGSTTSKAVLLATDGALLASSYAPSCGDPVTDARARLTELARLAEDAGATPTIRAFGVTGYGAPLVEAAFGADVTVVETIAHAKAAAHAAPGTEVVVDVGGTDVKVMRLAGERVLDFHLSNQCAAGLGAFLAGFAADLGVDVASIGEAALRAPRAPAFTVGCAIFLDTDRVTFQREGFTPDEVLAGLARALVRNVWEFVVPSPAATLGRDFLLTGGTHKNLAVAYAQAEYLREQAPNARVRVHPHPELCGAIGAALTAGARITGASRFVGFAGAHAVEVQAATGEATRCTRCELGCARTVLSISAGRTATDAREPRETRTLVVGNSCERGADVGSTRERSRAHAPDLLADEATRMFEQLLPRPHVAARPNAPVIGLPRVMGLYRCAPLVLHYLRALGVPDDRVVISPPTNEALYQDGARHGVADPCFPAKLVLSHVDWLLHRAPRPIDVLLMPAITHACVAPTGTTDTASCPIVTAFGHTTVAALRRGDDVLARRGVRALTPDFDLGDATRLGAQVFGAFRELLDVTAEQHARAFTHALAAQHALGIRLRRRGAKILAQAAEERRAVAVVLGRPYHADPGIQHGLSSELAARGIPVLCVTALPKHDKDALDLSRTIPQATNSGDAEKVWGARLVGRIRELVAVDVSSFKCGQDAGIAGVLGDVLTASGKPVLRMHDLDEDRAPASMRVAIETFVETVHAFERERLGASS